MLQKKVNLFGVLIDDVDIDYAINVAKRGLLFGEQKCFFTPNLEMLDGARKSAGVRSILNSASVSLPDGFGVNIVSHLLGSPINNQVAGIDFGDALLSLAENDGKKVFLLGGKEGVAQRALENLKKIHPNLLIVGTHHGYFSNDEIDGVSHAINNSNAEILIVCRGFPRQEKFVFLAKHKLKNIKVFACLGGAIDIWANDKKRAPKIMIKLHLEWLYRILCELERANKFIISLETLVLAIKIWFKNLVGNFGMKTTSQTYNQARKSTQN